MPASTFLRSTALPPAMRTWSCWRVMEPLPYRPKATTKTRRRTTTRKTPTKRTIRQTPARAKMPPRGTRKKTLSKKEGRKAQANRHRSGGNRQSHPLATNSGPQLRRSFCGQNRGAFPGRGGPGRASLLWRRSADPITVALYHRNAQDGRDPQRAGRLRRSPSTVKSSFTCAATTGFLLRLRISRPGPRTPRKGSP